MKTVSVALVLCLNIGVDPPDVVKTDPCARLECWIGELYQTILTFAKNVYSLQNTCKLQRKNFLFISGLEICLLVILLVGI